MAIKERVVVVSGATGGLGRVVSKAFADQGAKVALFGRKLEGLQEVATDLKLSDKTTLLHAVDVNDPAGLKAAAEAVVAKFGRADVFLHLVGGWSGGKPLVEVPAEDLKSMFDQHVWSAFYSIQAFVPHMLKNKWGRVIAISSPSASRVTSMNSPYATGKAGLEALFRALAFETKGTGVTANVLLVNKIDTEHERDKSPSADKLNWTTPEEIAAALLYLCSDEAQTVSGARLPVYGIL